MSIQGTVKEYFKLSTESILDMVVTDSEVRLMGVRLARIVQQPDYTVLKMSGTGLEIIIE